MGSVSSDEDFDTYDFDESALAQINAVETTLNGGSAHSVGKRKGFVGQSSTSGHAPRVLCPETPSAPPKQLRAPPEQSRVHEIAVERERIGRTVDDSLEIEDDWDDALLTELERVEQDVHNFPPRAIASKAPLSPTNDDADRCRSKAGKSSSNAFSQRTLFGDVLAAPTSGPGILVLSSQANVGGSRAGAPAKKARQTKQWDRTEYARSGARRLTATQRHITGERLRSSSPNCQSRGGDEPLSGGSERNQSGSPSFPKSNSPGMKLKIDLEAAKSFLYPVNMAKRDYQFNIVQRALYDNVLVALPTGLGKTFIAAVVILNFFRWYPQGKIVFVAPTKPLVAQQQMACHGICGLPWDVACEMTGNTTKLRRGDEWERKRIFYMTPQTLDNDIASGDVDPRDIICLVVDEAHRATGNYAYCNIVAQMQAVNPFFRILALTATPGSTGERVQEVIDNLHISYIELRAEDALDIRQYIHRKREEPVVVSMTDDFRHLRELYLQLMEDNCDALVKHGLLPRADAANLHHFRVRSCFRERADVLAKKRWLASVINETAKMAEARYYLDTFSVKMFRTRIQDLLTAMKKQDTKKLKLAQVINLAASIPDQAHPKMIAAVDTILAHFETERQSGNASTRVMVFCSLRECVHEIVEQLNHHPALKATPFIGQASDKQGRGLTQKQQQDIIAQFKRGTFNVIVATSIGEEGLDIGEVDLIVCYEAVKDSIRMLQRVGRTGRKREGKIVVLMAEGPESSVWQKSKDTYKSVQHTIMTGSSVTLFDDVPRLVPSNIRPSVTFEELDQPDFQPEMISTRKRAEKAATSSSKSQRRKDKHSDSRRNVPEGALMGFLNASTLRRRDLREVSNSDDEERHDRRALRSMPSQSKPNARSNVTGLSDDSDDEALERGLLFRDAAKASREKPMCSEANSGARHSKSVRSAAKDVPLEQHASAPTSGEAYGSRDFANAVHKRRVDDVPQIPARAVSKVSSASSHLGNLRDISSPRGTNGMHPLIADVLAKERTRDSKSASLSFDGPDQSKDDLSSTEEQGVDHASLSRPALPGDKAHRHHDSAHDALNTDLSVQKALPSLHGRTPSSALMPASGTDAPEGPLAKRQRTQSSDLHRESGAAAHRTSPAELTQVVSRRRQRPKKRIATMSSSESDDVLDSAHTHCRKSVPHHPTHPTRSGDTDHLSCESGSSVDDRDPGGHPTSRSSARRELRVRAKKPRETKKRIGTSPTSKMLFRFEADRDTDEDRRAVDRSDSADEGLSTDRADSSDLEHVGDFQPTQAPRGYNQQSVYQQSLLTQCAPVQFTRQRKQDFLGGRFNGQKAFGSGSAERSDAIAHHGAASGGPRRVDRSSQTDQYSLGSFVCGDDEEVLYATESEEETGSDNMD